MVYEQLSSSCAILIYTNSVMSLRLVTAIYSQNGSQIVDIMGKHQSRTIEQPVGLSDKEDVSNLAAR